MPWGNECDTTMTQRTFAPTIQSVMRISMNASVSCACACDGTTRSTNGSIRRNQ